jgi:hypothetical protein
MPGSSEGEPAEAGARPAYAMAIVFGLLSVPWTFGFEQVAGLPLWPSFLASASFFAAGGGPRGLTRSLANNALGALYAAATLALVASAGLGVVGLSLLVGAGMFAASLHALVNRLSFTPAAFVGYAAAFGVDATGARLASTGPAGTLTATLAAMAIGAGLGWLAETAADSALRACGAPSNRAS